MPPVLLTLLVSSLAMVLIVVMGTPMAWLLVRRRRTWFTGAVETLLLLPIVLPPTVVGFGLLLLLGRSTAFGQWLNDVAGIRLLFTWQGAVIAAAFMAFPLYVRTLAVSFGELDPALMEIGTTLGANERQLLFWVALPLSARGIGAGVALAFARAAGEFGATLMVAGSIPGRTQTMPIALYEAVMAGHDSDALLLALGLVSLTLVAVGLMTLLKTRRPWGSAGF